MAYTPTTWVNGSSPYLNAANLNKMEQGIAQAHAQANSTPAVLHVADYGAVGDFVTDDRAAIQAAIDDATNVTNLGMPAVVQLMRRHRIGARPSPTYPGEGLVINRPCIIQGYGAPGGTVLAHMDSFTGWLVTVEYAGRNSQKEVANLNTYDPSQDQSGVQFRDFQMTGLNRNNTHHGIRILRADDVRIWNVEATMLKGTAWQFGDKDGLRGNQTGCIRESHGYNMRTFYCGDGDNVASVYIGQFEGTDPINNPATSDGTNQLYFQNFDLVYNYGGMHIVNHHTATVLRRVIFDQCQIHGLSQGAIGNLSNYDLVRVEGLVNTVMMRSVITNSAGGNGTPPTFPFMRVRESTISGKSPQHILVDGLSCSSADADVFLLEDCVNFSLTNASPVLSGIAGALVRVIDGSGLLSWKIQGIQNSSTDYSSKIVIPAQYLTRGSIDWAPWSLPGGSGGSGESPFAAYIVRESGGVLPSRATVTDDNTRSILVLSNQDPYAAGYIAGVDVWLDPA